MRICVPISYFRGRLLIFIYCYNKWLYPTLNTQIHTMHTKYGSHSISLMRYTENCRAQKFPFHSLFALTLRRFCQYAYDHKSWHRSHFTKIIDMKLILIEYIGAVAAVRAPLVLSIKQLTDSNGDPCLDSVFPSNMFPI